MIAYWPDLPLRKGAPVFARVFFISGNSSSSWCKLQFRLAKMTNPFSSALASHVSSRPFAFITWAQHFSSHWKTNSCSQFRTLVFPSTILSALSFLFFLFANPLTVFSDSSHFCVARYLIVCTLETYYYYTHTQTYPLFGAFIFLFPKRIIPSKKAMLIRNGWRWDQIHIRNTSFIALREMTWY